MLPRSLASQFDGELQTYRDAGGKPFTFFWGLRALRECSRFNSCLEFELSLILADSAVE
jgi:hypothetical protein